MRIGVEECVKWEPESKESRDEMFNAFKGSELEYFPYDKRLLVVLRGRIPADPETKTEAQPEVKAFVKAGSYVVRGKNSSSMPHGTGLEVLSETDINARHPIDEKTIEERKAEEKAIVDAKNKLADDLIELEQLREEKAIQEAREQESKPESKPEAKDGGSIETQGNRQADETNEVDQERLDEQNLES